MPSYVLVMNIVNQLSQIMKAPVKPTVKTVVYAMSQYLTLKSNIILTKKRLLKEKEIGTDHQSTSQKPNSENTLHKASLLKMQH